MPNKTACIDCAKLVWKPAKRCKPCNGKHMVTRSDCHCVDCNMQIQWGSTRCLPCHNKNQLTNHSTRAERTRFTNSPAWKSVRAECYERDNYTCRRCQVRGGELNAHHTKQWADYPEFRLDIDNLVTLCRSCHEHIHWRTLCGK
jgi:5-methylcytosine-specific restriction endonuclease McrA